jgi:hypothetical protein
LMSEQHCFKSLVGTLIQMFSVPLCFLLFMQSPSVKTKSVPCVFVVFRGLEIG